MDKKTSGANLLSKAVDVLDAVSASNTPLTVAGLAQILGWTRPTTHRIVAALTERGLLRLASQQKTLHLGPHLFELAHRSWSDVDLRGAAADPLARVAARLGATAVLATPANGEFVILDRTSDSPRGVYSVGRSYPLLSSAIGKAILAFETSPLASGSWPGEAGEMTAEEVNDIQLTDARGYALTVEDEDHLVIAAPVFDIFEKVIASIGVVLDAAATRQPHALAPLVVDAAREVISNVGAAIKTTDIGLRPPPTQMHTVTELAKCDLLLGRSPHFVSDTQLVCVDTLGPKLWSIDTQSGQTRSYRNPTLLGGVLGLDSGTLAVLDQTGLREVSSLEALHEGPQDPIVPPHSRFNAVSLDPCGNVWGAQMDLDGRTGRGDIVQLTTEGGYFPLGYHLSMPGGLAWDGRNHTLYFTDSILRRVYAVDLDDDCTPKGRPRTFWSYRNEDGKPDAIAVDPHGSLWVTVWDGWRIDRFEPNGRLVRSYPVPVPRPSGIAASGERVVVTTSRLRLSQETLEVAPMSGGLFLFEPDGRATQ